MFYENIICKSLPENRNRIFVIKFHLYSYEFWIIYETFSFNIPHPVQNGFEKIDVAFSINVNATSIRLGKYFAFGAYTNHVDKWGGCSNDHNT